MKNRIFNVFYRKTKNKKIANVLTIIAYGLLLIYYNIKRLFCNKTLSISKEEAYEKVNSISKRPTKKYTYNERIINENIDLSIIIPAYNVSKYIEECLNGVLNQKTKYNYEAIVINDGSKDNTLDLIYKYKDNKHIKIINQENKGFSGARNVGIDEAVGKYIMFVDSDDILCENAIENLMKVAVEKDASIVQGSFYEFYDANAKLYTDIKPCEKDGQDPKEPLGTPGYPWGKVYKAELFNKVRFPLDFWYEDTIVSYLLCRKCKKYVAISDYVYGYRKNYESITYTSKKSTKVLDTYWVVEEVLNIAKEIGIKNDEITYKMTINQLSNLLYRRIHFLDEEIIKNTFILACYLIDEISFELKEEKSKIFKDLEKAFKTRNYELWKLCSFII